MPPTQKWLKAWEKLRVEMTPSADLNKYFEQKVIAGKNIAVINIGLCSIPSGKILVGDPLCYLIKNDKKPYFIAAKAGAYDTEISVVKPADGDCARYAAVRIRFSDAPVVHFEEMLKGDEDFTELEREEYFGFTVDAGLACICDEKVYHAFCDFAEKWHEQNTGNFYEDYFAPLFAESYVISPEFQRSSGDWLNWVIPCTEYHMPIFQSGFGDGVYPAYWGYDKNGKICQMIVQFIDIEAAYSEKDK